MDLTRIVTDMNVLITFLSYLTEGGSSYGMLNR